MFVGIIDWEAVADRDPKLLLLPTEGSYLLSFDIRSLYILPLED